MSIASEITRLQNAKASIKTSIENKGVTVPSATTLDGYSTLVDAIPAAPVEPEEKAVNFYDYDGTRLYSYTKSEFLNLTEMPANPTHEGLTAQGWTYTLANAKEYLQDPTFYGSGYNYDELEIGQMYDTVDSGLWIWLDLEEHSLNGVTLTFQALGGCEIDWGDGNTSLCGPNIVTASHTYTQAGKYCIKMTTTATETITIAKDFIGAEHKQRVYKINVGSCVSFVTGTGSGSGVFYDLQALKYITLPEKTDLITSSIRAVFQFCRALKCIIIPRGVANLSNQLFAECFSIEHIILPDTLSNTNTQIKDSSFYNCSSLKKITLPAVIVNGAKDYIFQYCSNLYKIIMPADCTLSNYTFYAARYTKIFDFTHYTAVPTLPSSSNTFGDIRADYKIVVPDNLYTSWSTASGWSSLSTHIVRKSDFYGS